MYGGKEEGSKLRNVVGTGNRMDQGAAVFIVVIVWRMVFGGRRERQREKEEEECWRVSGIGTCCFPPRTLVAQLQDVIAKLTLARHPHVLSMPDTVPNQETFDSLNVPDLPQPLV